VDAVGPGKRTGTGCQHDSQYALAGRADLRDGQPLHPPPAGQRCTGVASLGLPPGLARGWASARPTGRHTTPSVQDRHLVGLGRRTSRRPENPEKHQCIPSGQHAASAYWRRWLAVERTSWPVSRILRLPKITINYVRRAVGVLLAAVNHGQKRVTVTGPDRRSRLLTAQWAQSSKLAMPIRSRSPAPPHRG
jgi:hypothetical protein